ncbi:DUF4153 domain-containing protein [Siminovitchia sediminis]|uniref:DUF4153 domain-containing protein n=1 Tax=Siminovitchia sediminis TaxID=1274353 RepID=A0ABW4KGD1_9BACI
MSIMKGLKSKLAGLFDAVYRYPLTMLFLLAAATVNINMIHHETEKYVTYFLAFLIGALLSVTAQQVFERFFNKVSERMLLNGGTVLLTAGYFIAIRSAGDFNLELGTKTAVAVFALIMAFLWVPSIKSKVTFHDSFMAVFKAFLTTILFSAVIGMGLNAILMAVDELLFSLHYKIYSHVLNLIGTLFAPILFLSFIPPYPGKKDEAKTEDELANQTEEVEKAVHCPKILEVLISYIIIPLTALYTVILLVYVLLNIRGDFWSNNLMEPMLVSYAITVIVVYLLASSIQNKFSAFFRRVFPKVLLPIVLFQTIASVLKIGEMGLTHGRYYVIMFGVFALIAAVIFSFFSPGKNGWIAAVLLVFSAVSVIPPVDAFTTSRNNQTNLLKSTLEENNMFENGEVIPNGDISTEDKQRITKTVSYLDRMDYTKRIDWLPDNIFYNNQFKDTFGFEEVYVEPDGEKGSQYAHLDWEQSPVVNVEDYDRMLHLTIFDHEEKDSGKEIQFEVQGAEFTLVQGWEENDSVIRLINEQGNEFIQVQAKEVFDEILGDEKSSGGQGKELSVESATVTRENDQVRFDFLIQSVDRYNDQYYADMYVFIQVKEGAFVNGPHD